MWTSGSRNHTPKHHSPLPNKPDVLVTPALRPGGSYANDPAATALNVDWQPSQAPFLDRAAGADCPGSARQRLALDPALIGPHPPATARLSRNEVDVRPPGRERETTNGGRHLDGRKMELGATSFEAAAAVRARVGLELNPLGGPNGQMRRQ